MMKKRALALVLSSVLVLTSTITASATPDSSTLSETRAQYEQIQQNINEIQDKIYDFEKEMEELNSKVESNKQEIENTNTIIDNTKKDIENCKEEITKLDAALGERVKAMHMSGNLEFSYLTFLLDSESTADFFGRIQTVSKIIGKDKDAIEGVQEKEEELNTKKATLEEKISEITKLNEEVKTSLEELDSKKKEQEVLIAEAEQEKTKFDSEYLADLERDVVKAQFDVINSSSSTSSQINSAVQQLRDVRDSQLKSETVKAEVNAMIEKGKTAYNQKKASEAAAINRGQGSTSTPTVSGSGSASTLLNEAYKHLGKAYVFGATGPSNFDCSGFTQYVYRVALGIDISRTTYTQIGYGTPVSQANLQPGDLVFPHSGHVGIYIGNGQMIHAPQTGDVIKVSSVYAFYAARRII